MSPLILRIWSALCYALRKKKLKDFTTEDYRILVGQNIGLDHLMPNVMKILEQDILAAGDFYEGDLLQVTLWVDKAFWEKNPGLKARLVELVERNKELLQSFDTLKKIRKEIFQGYEELQGDG